MMKKLVEHWPIWVSNTAARLQLQGECATMDHRGDSQ